MPKFSPEFSHLEQTNTAGYVNSVIEAANKKAKEVGVLGASAVERIGVFDSAGVPNVLDDSDAPEAVHQLLSKLPQEVQFSSKGAVFNTASAVFDSIGQAMQQYEQRHGHKAPAWVVDDAIRSAVPLVNRQYASELGVESSVSGVFDNASSVSGGAMAVSQIITAIFTAMDDDIPFAGRVAVGNGLEARVVIAGTRTESATGDYAQFAPLDGVNSGKNFMMSIREAQATESNGTWTATIKNAAGDTNGSPVMLRGSQVIVNGFPVGFISPSQSQNHASAPFSGIFKLPSVNGGVDTTISGSLNATTGVATVSFTPALPANAVVHVSSSINYEHDSMATKRPILGAVADALPVVASISSGRFRLSQEAKMQWNTELRLDPFSMNNAALRAQRRAEGHMLAITRMYRIGRMNSFEFDMKLATRQDERSVSRIMEDLKVILGAADVDMISRTNLNGIGVIYVGKAGISYLESLSNDYFVASGIKHRAGTYRLGKLFGLYDVYATQNANLNPQITTGFPMLCIGTSDQVGAMPYMTGSAMAATLLPLAVGDDGKQGQLFFEAGVDSINPHVRAAQAACVVNVKF